MAAFCKADAEHHDQDENADDQATAQLVEVVNDAQPVFIANRP